MKKLSKLFKALGDGNRLRILKILQRFDFRCVCEISHVLGIGLPATSRHLKILEDVGLISSEKDGKWVNYSLRRKSEDSAVVMIMGLLGAMGEEDSLTVSDMEKMERTCRCDLCK